MTKLPPIEPASGHRTRTGAREIFWILSTSACDPVSGPDTARDPAQDVLEARNHAGMSARPAAKERPRGKISAGQVIYYNREAATEKNYKINSEKCQYFLLFI